MHPQQVSSLLSSYKISASKLLCIHLAGYIGLKFLKTNLKGILWTKNLEIKWSGILNCHENVINW